MPLVADTVFLPITCPTCGLESLTDFPALVVLVALTQWNQLALYTSCHPGSWDASPPELNKIREHLGVAWIERHRRLLDRPFSTRRPLRPR